MVEESSLEFLLGIEANQHKGLHIGIPSIYSANSWVIEAVLLHELNTLNLVLIESTCNHVNQFGGYTGMTPENFISYIREIANKVDFPIERVILGGDHLGPFPWQAQSAEKAMSKLQKKRTGYQHS
jgi:D-tagatose-1,6-bisphosphate aldolase subunit GatZ/KbaZ